MLVQREAPAVAAGVPFTGQVKLLRGQGRGGGGGLGQGDGELPPLALDEAGGPLGLPQLAEEGSAVLGFHMPQDRGGIFLSQREDRYLSPRGEKFSRRTIL